MYGILTLNGIYIPRLGIGGGLGYIVFGVLLIFIGLYFEYLDQKKSTNSTLELKKNKTKQLLDYFCILIYGFGLIYFLFYIFEIHRSDYIFIMFVLIFVLCGERVSKFFE